MSDASQQGASPSANSPAKSPKARYVEELLRDGLDRYEILRLLGEGGMGEVYLGVHRTIEKQVAIKTLGYQHRDDPSLNERFLREAKAASKIRNEHIVDITDFGNSPQGCSYFVMEWLEGEDLSATMEREAPFPWPRARAFLLQVLEALQAAHDAGVIHRDVKPANCFRTTRNHNSDFIKVLDFGIARAPGEHGEALTGTGMILGTAEYIAPEQGRAEPVDARTDIYAVGVMMFEMLAGRRPFRGRTAIELVAKHLTERAPLLRQSSPQPLPPDLDRIVASCLEKDPALRFDSAASLADALIAVPETVAPQPSAASLPPEVMSTQLCAPTVAPVRAEPRQTGGTFKPWMVAIPIALVVGVGAASGALLFSNGDDGSDGPASEAQANLVLPSGPAPDPPAAAVAKQLQCPDGMVLLSGGPFFMGSDGDSKILESAMPPHIIELVPYCLDIHEATLTEYRECSRAGECRRAFRRSEWPRSGADAVDWAAKQEAFSELCNERATGHGDHPVNCIDYEQAETFCSYLGKRLPSEAQWEFAARGSDGRVYPWGDAAPTERLASACGIECRRWRQSRGLEPGGTMFETDDGYVGTAPVMRFEGGRTETGLYDMVGNVFEWTSSDFLPYTKQGYGPAPPEAPPRKVIRGGAFNSGHPDFARPAMRAPMSPSAHTHGIGVRCAGEPFEP